ncbi:MAG: adenylate/guanylate cyclase domain-containing protein [Chloroflexota bacterium]|nr:adenylate/guanylate cyclase domain-containing protein [Chloroflexota bacterium]
MEPRIQYATTADGVSIAFWAMGEGEPLVHMMLGPSHIQMEWQIPEYHRWYERLAEKRKLVRYDVRGFGLSERDITEFPLDTQILDLEAVVDRLGLEKFALLGLMHSGPGAIEYAARHPERVSHLLLWCTYARASEWGPPSQVQAVRALIGGDWRTYTETVAHTTLGWSEGEPARRYAATIRESCTPEVLQAAFRAVEQFDVAALLPHVGVPTLVLQRREAPPGIATAGRLASRIPDARLVVLEGESLAAFLGDTEAVLAAIDEFLGGGEEARTEAAPVPAAVHTILFTDVEGSTALTQRLGDAGARAVLREHERIVREALRAHGGSEVKTMGDGFMASFGSASKALECAIAMQRAFAAWDAGVGAGLAPPEGAASSAPPQGAASSAPTEAIRVRIGLNAGEPIAEEEDLFGTAVILAARIAAQAEGGEILVANVIRELAAGKGFLFADRGETVLRGFEDPVRLYEVRWREDTH